MEYQIKYENGIANHGNLYRLKKVMDRAKAGEALNIAFLGGSIRCWCYRGNESF